MISWEGVQGAARTHLLGSPGYLCHLPPSLTGTWFPDDLPGFPQRTSAPRSREADPTWEAESTKAVPGPGTTRGLLSAGPHIKVDMKPAL